MTYATEYRGDGQGHPWQRIADDVNALRTFIAHVSHAFPVQDAWVVVTTGNGQGLTAFSDGSRAETFAAKVRAEMPEAASFGGNVKPRVLVHRVYWPRGARVATVLSFLNDSVADDFILAIPPVPAVAYVCPEFRNWGIGGPDNVEGGYVSVLELDGPTAQGGW